MALPSLAGIQAFFNAMQEVKVTVEPKFAGPVGVTIGDMVPACVASVPPALALPVLLAVAAGSGVGVVLLPTQVLGAAAVAAPAVVPPVVPATASVPLVVAAIGTASPVVVVLPGPAKFRVV